MKIILSYVNTRGDTVHLDRKFNRFSEIHGWAAYHHPDWTSYQIIVTRDRTEHADVS
jgi:hypothetical protein